MLQSLSLQSVSNSCTSRSAGRGLALFRLEARVGGLCVVSPSANSDPKEREETSGFKSDTIALLVCLLHRNAESVSLIKDEVKVAYCRQAGGERTGSAWWRTPEHTTVTGRLSPGHPPSAEHFLYNNKRQRCTGLDFHSCLVNQCNNVLKKKKKCTQNEK